jgi:hypothetical protein
MADPAANPLAAAGAANPPADTAANPFKAVALLLKSVRTALENPREGKQTPRWVRIGRIRNFQGETDSISTILIPAVDGFTFAMFYLGDLTLRAKDLLIQADAATALVEVSAELLKTITTDEFASSLSAIVGEEKVSNPLKDGGTYINKAVDIVKRVPTPEDLDVMGAELYALLCIEQLPLGDANIDKAERHLDINKSGKLRLLQLALSKPVRVRGLGKSKTGEQNITYLGARRVFQAPAAGLPGKAKGFWGPNKDSEEVIYEFDFATEQTGKDIEEANNLLESLGFVEPASSDKKVFDDKLAQRLRRFQKINGLQITGALDNSTLNRLTHLNFETKTLERAKPFNAADLQGFDDTKNPA